MLLVSKKEHNFYRLWCKYYKSMFLFCKRIIMANAMAITCSKLTIETLEQGVKYIRS